MVKKGKDQVPKQTRKKTESDTLHLGPAYHRQVLSMLRRSHDLLCRYSKLLSHIERNAITNMPAFTVCKQDVDDTRSELFGWLAVNCRIDSIGNTPNVVEVEGCGFRHVAVDSKRTGHGGLPT
jgi:hypothetical protein